MQTELDAEIVGWLGRVGGEHVQRRFQINRTRAYRRLLDPTEAGLLAQRRLLHQRPGTYAATVVGLRWRGRSLGALRLAPGSFEQAWRLTTTAVTGVGPT